MEKFGCKKITITGGEPLLQKEELEELVRRLWFNKCYVSVETNGSIIPFMGYVGSWVLDYKLPSSGMEKHMDDVNFTYLVASDYVKFVIQDEVDYKEACYVKERLEKKGCKANFAFGTVYEELAPSVLIEWLKRDEIFDVQINVQLHKLLGLESEEEE